MRLFPLWLFGWLTLNASADEPATLKLTQTIPLPGVHGRFDHFSVDAKGKRLFVAALGNDTLEVVDVAANKPLHSITGLHKPTGVAFLPEWNRLIVANGGDGTLKVFDGDTYQLVKSLGSLDDADNLRYDPKARLLYLSYGNGALGVIDPAALAPVASIKLKAHPESFQLEQDGPRIFVNVPDAKQVAVVDRTTRTVTETWSTGEFRANFPMALDEANQRLFVGCRNPARLVVLDTKTGKPVADLAIAGDADDLFFDAPRKRLYVSCGVGFVDVLEIQSADAYRLRERIPTVSGARTSFFSAMLNTYFVAHPLRGTEMAGIRVFQVTE